MAYIRHKMRVPLGGKLDSARLADVWGFSGKRGRGALEISCAVNDNVGMRIGMLSGHDATANRSREHKQRAG